jgi:hypothetical protein
MGTQRMSDEELVVHWLNSAGGTPAYRRVVDVYNQLTYLDSEYRRWQEALAANSSYDFKVSFRALGRQHAKLNKVLSRYRTVPQIQYWLANAMWTVFTASCPTRGDYRLPFTNDLGQKFFVQEGTVVSLLLKLAESRNLSRVRLCAWCKKGWRVSLRSIDRFCTDKCRLNWYFNTDEGKRRHKEAQKKYKKSPGAQLTRLEGERVKNAEKIVRNLGRERTRKSQRGEK